MNLTIDFNDETTSLTDDHFNLLQEVIEKAALAEELSGELELSLTFVDEKTIQQLNKEYRDKDMPTDVLSFALEEMEEDEVEIIGIDLPRALGDIIISVSHIHDQAEKYNHSFERELGFLALHGFLHLLGYDHMTEEDERIMFGKQREILDEYGLKR
ncbi:rRNA maturation RNase YbeY [Lottiidibacillus patelloidae]|uniref:Endoribonuclease YbeY n=1 Tax=Lottiidibacillus patelloidae TaxID=2670334 RepID=A0A263BW76_9BACI|nr:rRNA maturation RNase YbeY [Lottiidibacillus patelloidae]OZM58001.1 rRNA maturation RNase YbeY [Lottiidibacillus patelloidae]